MKRALEMLMANSEQKVSFLYCHQSYNFLTVTTIREKTWKPREVLEIDVSQEEVRNFMQSRGKSMKGQGKRRSPRKFGHLKVSTLYFD